MKFKDVDDYGVDSQAIASGKHYIATSHYSSHIEETSQSGNKANDST